MSELIERMARALCESVGEDPDFCNGKGFEPAWTAYRQKARAALASIREPTPAMCFAGANACMTVCGKEGRMFEDAAAVWRAMIDEGAK